MILIYSEQVGAFEGGYDICYYYIVRKLPDYYISIGFWLTEVAVLKGESYIDGKTLELQYQYEI